MTHPESAPAANPNRLLSLDVFRGITIAFMILVNSPGNQTSYSQLDHSEWNGCTLTDLVFPFFVFIVGVSLVFALSKRLEHGASRGEILKKVFNRTVIIFLFGLLLNGFPYYHLDTIRILGVLQRIAICYFFASVAFLYLRTSTQAALATVLLVGYWLAMTWIPVPGYGVGDLGVEGNLAAYIDRFLLGHHTYRGGVYDPEGFLSTLPAIATALIGNLTGVWLRSSHGKEQKVRGLIIAGTTCAAMGWAWDKWFPINKALWTSSYVLWTAGLALYLLALCYGLIEIKGWKRGSRPFEIFGINAIAAYLLHVFFLKVQNLIHLPRLDGTPGNLRFFITEHLFGWASLQNASLFYALSYVLLWWVLLSTLYRRKIFLKI
jgi:predicted acyltransferase